MTIVQSWRLTTLRERTGDELGLLVDGLFGGAHLDRKKIKGVILASVVPPLTMPAQEMVQRYFGLKTMTVEPGLNTGMPILYDTPADVGADRIVNGIAAYEKHGRATGSPLVVVDFGTATTLDAISGKGEYSAAPSARASRFPRTRCFSARRGCRRSTSASRRPSSDAPPSARWSRGCSGATSTWSKDSCAA